MKTVDQMQETEKLSVEKIIGLIREGRNNRILLFLEDQVIRSYFIRLFGKELSAVKMEFLKRDLKALLMGPVDLIHYSLLIRQIRETCRPSLVESNSEPFDQEIESIFRKYNY